MAFGHSAALCPSAPTELLPERECGTIIVARFRAARALGYTRILAADQASAEADAALAEATGDLTTMTHSPWRCRPLAKRPITNVDINSP